MAGCSDAVSEESSAPDRDCITDFDPSVDYFPDKSEVLDAENFTLTYQNSFQVLTVEEPFPGADPETYVLVKCGAPAPELSDELASAQQVTVPISSLYSDSTTHLPLITELGRLSTLTGVANGAVVSDPDVVDRIEAGQVQEYASAGTTDAEAVVMAGPDVLMTGGIDDPAHRQLRDAGIGVVANAEWLESSPLGRAEWIKVMGALTGQEVKASEVYDGIRGRYRAVAETAAGAEPAEVVMGSLSQGTWYMPSSGSYAGRLVADAGGRWAWQDTGGSGSLSLDFEAVLARAADAPTWLVITTEWTSIADILATDERYARFAAIDDGRVYNATKAIGPHGGNDYYERGVLRPDLILADLLAILHPELLEGHDFEFYQQLPA